MFGQLHSTCSQVDCSSFSSAIGQTRQEMRTVSPSAEDEQMWWREAAHSRDRRVIGPDTSGVPTARTALRSHRSNLHRLKQDNGICTTCNLTTSSAASNNRLPHWSLHAMVALITDTNSH